MRSSTTENRTAMATQAMSEKLQQDVEIQFEGNTVFSDGQLRGAMKFVKEAGLITRFKSQDILDREKLDYDLHLVDNYMRSKGYLQARHGEPRIDARIVRRDDNFHDLPP